MANRKPSKAQESAGELTPTELKVDIPNENATEKPIPEVNETQKEMPKDYNVANSVTIDGETREIKGTKLKYHRNRTAVAYRILQIYPLPDILGMDKGIMDPDRDGDQILFDFLVAVFDDAKFVQRHYDNMTAEDIDKIVEIFCRVNGISEKEEQAKNRQAKATRT